VDCEVCGHTVTDEGGGLTAAFWHHMTMAHSIGPGVEEDDMGHSGTDEKVDVGAADVAKVSAEEVTEGLGAEVVTEGGPVAGQGNVLSDGTVIEEADRDGHDDNGDGLKGGKATASVHGDVLDL
jgi:hypothetical protein